MKTKKIIYFILIFIMIILFQNKVNAANTTVENLKSKYPAGKFWNHYVGSGHNYWNGIEDSGNCNNPNGYTNYACAYHDGTTASIGQIDCNSFNGGQECAGFARKLFYDYYGIYATNMTKTYNKNSIKPGDVIRYEGDGAAVGGHEVWVIGVDNEKLIVAECNWYNKCQISWDRWVYKNNISIDYIWPAPYEINDNKKEEIFVPNGTKQNLGTEFIAQIVPKASTSYAIEATSSSNGGNVYLQTKSTSSKAQQWKFSRYSDGSYSIINMKTGLGLDIYNTGNIDGEKVQVWGHSDGDKQRWFIYSYNGGYRLVPKSSSTDKRAVDIPSRKFTNGANLQLWQAVDNTNAAQTFNIIKYVYNISLNTTSCQMSIGGTKQLTATVTPSDATNKTLSWSSSNTNVATVSSSGLVKAVGTGSTTITVKTTDGSNISKTCSVTVKNTTPQVLYSTHVQNQGWQNYTSNGATAGTTGKGLRLEGIKIKLNSQYSGGISYSTHIQNIGWQSTVSNDTLSGTTGKSLRLEAIKINLTGNIANYYDIYYRVHTQNFGWLGWAKNGQLSGTAGYSYRLEGIQIVLVEKGNSAPGSTTNAFYEKSSVTYSTHVQNIGWQNYVSNGVTAGTTGKSLRLEGIKIKLNSQYSGGISYSTHIQNIGWQSAVSNNALSGTSGKSLRLEAIKINLTGEIAKYYDIYYRVHAQNFGWLGWAKNGEESGTQGYGYRLEGIQIVLVKKGNSAPGSTSNRFVKK